MKIIRLEILHLASLDRQGGEVINFEEGALGESTIFSIVGPTGSGKSTLLDAICLALYGRAPRYPRKPGERKGIEIYGEKGEGERNRPAPTDCVNILTRGKKSGYSKLTFKANNGNLYRAEWHVRFKTKEYDRPTTRLYLLTTENGQVKEEEANWEDTPAIVGLDYEQFLRTVLIAQGSFANFLTAKEDERYQLLEKLIGSEELYTVIASKIKEQKDKASTAYSQLAASLSAYEKDLIPDEELQEFEQRLRSLEEEEKNAKAELGRIVESLGWYAAEDQFAENLMKHEAMLRQSQQHLEAMKAESDLLKLHDATLTAVGYYRDIQKARKKIDSQEQQLTTLGEKLKEKQTEITGNSDALAVLKEAAAQASQALDDQKPHINKARTIKGELASARKTLEEKENARKETAKAFEKAQQAASDNAKAIEAGQQSLNKAERELNDLKSAVSLEMEKKKQAASQAGQAFEAEEAKTKGLDATHLRETEKKANKNRSDIAEAILICQSIEKLQESIGKNEKEIGQLSMCNKTIDEEMARLDTEALKKEVETLQKAYTLMTSENWEQHRQDLEDGKPCPLCGAIHHPYTSHEAFAPVVTVLEEHIHQMKQELETKDQKIQLLSGEKNRNAGAIEEKNVKLKELREESNTKQACKSAILAEHPDWNEDTEQLKALQQRINEEAEKAGQALTDYTRLVKTVDRLRKEKEKAEKALREYTEQSNDDIQKAERKKSAAETMLSTEKGKTNNLKTQEAEKGQALENANEALSGAKNEVESKMAALKSETGGKDPDTFEKELNAAKQKADEYVKKQEAKIGELEKEKEGLLGQISATEKAKDSEERLLSEKTPQLESWLSNYNASPDHPQPLTTDDIASISESKADWEALRQQQYRLTEAATTAKTTYENEKKSHDEHQKKKPTADRQTLTARKTELEQLSNTQLVECQARKKRHENAKQQLGALHEEAQQKALLKKEWEEIDRSIGTDGKTLRKIAQCYTLRFLIAHANDEIRKFNSRYELQQVKNSLGIRVIDHDRADDIRDTTSLSGGETFIVSLGLALGLSALSSKNISFENLFIDEGFGTLDHDTLETVINSLAMLQSSQGKKVGVISHTDSMSRITTQIRVISNGSSGSSHIEIYP